jgi:hypothetical protein
MIIDMEYMQLEPAVDCEAIIVYRLSGTSFEVTMDQLRKFVIHWGFCVSPGVPFSYYGVT